MILPEDKESKEFHYLQFECTTDEYKLDYSIIKKVFSNFRNPNLNFKDWVITDFDDHLRGNKMIEADTDLIRERNE